MNITVMSTRYSCQHRVVVGQRCHRIASLLRLALTGIASTHYCNIHTTRYKDRRFYTAPSGDTAWPKPARAERKEQDGMAEDGTGGKGQGSGGAAGVLEKEGKKR